MLDARETGDVNLAEGNVDGRRKDRMVNLSIQCLVEIRMPWSSVVRDFFELERCHSCILNLHSI